MNQLIDCYMCGMALLPRDPYEEMDCFEELPFSGVAAPNTLHKQETLNLIDLCEEPIIIETSKHYQSDDDDEDFDKSFNCQEQIATHSHDSSNAPDEQDADGQYFLVQERPPPLFSNEASI